MFLLLVVVITMIIRLRFLPPFQERYHWLTHLGIRVIIDEFDVDYGAGMSAT